MSQIRYMPHIDGLRAVAVIPVILFHMKYSWIKGGFIGVDVFFVISGYLITSILLRELNGDAFTFLGFWARRVRRIFPAMLTVTISTLLFAYLFIFRGDLPGIGKQAVFALLSLANFYFWRATNDYWGAAAEESPFLHTWSLSVEEQFYLFFPVALWLVHRVHPKTVRAFLCILAFVSYAVFVWGTINRPAATFYLLPTRAWELASGGLLATFSTQLTLPRRLRGGLATVGFTLILASFVFVGRLSGWMLAPVLGTVLVIRFGGVGISTICLTSAPMLHIGRISYSLYLWHWPVLVFANQLGFSGNQLFLAVPIYFLSLMTYLLVETPTRKSRRAVAISLITSLSVLAAAAGITQSSGYYDISDIGFARPHWYGRFYDLQPRVSLGELYEVIANSMDAPRREVGDESYLEAGIVVKTDGDESPQVILLGDSHGVMWSDAVRKACENTEASVSLWSLNGVKPFIHFPISDNQEVFGLTSAEKERFDKARVDAIGAWRPVIILAPRWSNVAEEDATGLISLAQDLGCKVLLLEQPPELEDVGERSALQYAYFKGMRPRGSERQYFPMGEDKKVQKGRRMLQRLASRFPNCSIIPVHSLYARGDKALLIDGNQVIYVDDDHLTTYGASLAIPVIEESIRDAIEGR